MLEPVPQYGSFDERTNEQNRDILPRPIASYGEFPGSEEVASPPGGGGRGAGARTGRSQSVQTPGVGEEPSILAAVETNEDDLLIEDTTTAARRVKGGINRINYWTGNCNKCWRANEGRFGQRLRPVFCGGGGFGTHCGDMIMLFIYVWFTVILPAFGAVACVQFGFFLCPGCAPINWIALVTDLWALFTVLYILYILDYDYKVFKRNFFFVEVPPTVIPGHINYFLKLTMSNVHRIQILERRQRDRLMHHLQNRQDATLHIMMYTHYYLNYVHRKPKRQMYVALLAIILVTAGNICGIYFEWKRFGFDLGPWY